MRRISLFAEIPPLIIGKRQYFSEKGGEKDQEEKREGGEVQEGWSFVIVGNEIILVKMWEGKKGKGGKGGGGGKEGEGWFVLKTPHEHPISCGVVFGEREGRKEEERKGGQFFFSFPSSTPPSSSSVSPPLSPPSFQLWTGDDQGYICVWKMKNNTIFLSDALSPPSSTPLTVSLTASLSPSSSSSYSISCMGVVGRGGGREVWAGSSTGEITRWKASNHKYLGILEGEKREGGKEREGEREGRGRAHETVVTELVVREEKIFSVSWDQKVKRWRKGEKEGEREREGRDL